MEFKVKVKDKAEDKKRKNKRWTCIVTNNMKPRTHECIALRQSINMQETHIVFSIDMGSLL